MVRVTILRYAPPFADEEVLVIFGAERRAVIIAHSRLLVQCKGHIINLRGSHRLNIIIEM